MSINQGKKIDAKYIIKLVIALLFLFVLGRICPTWGGITRMGVEAIFILVGGILMISFGFDLACSSLFIMIAMICTGYTDGETLMATLGGSSVFQLIIIFVLVYALSETGADATIARILLSRKVLNGRPALFSIVFFFAVSILGALSPLGGYLFGVAMIKAIAKAAGYDEKDNWMKAMMTGTILCASVGGGTIPFKGMASVIYNMFVETYTAAGIEINEVQYMIVAFTNMIVLDIVFGLLLKPFFRVDYTKIKNVDVASLAAEGGTHLNKRMVVCLILFICSFLYSIIILFIPESDSQFYLVFSNLSQGMWFCLFLCLMAIIRIDGKPLVVVDRDLGKSVRWGVVLSVCAFTSIGNMVGDEELGVMPWLGNIINPLFQNMPFIIFVIILIVITLLFTNVLNNTAAAVIIATVISPIVVNYAAKGINVVAIVPALVQCGLCAFILMAAGGSAPLYLSEPCIKEKPGWVYKHIPASFAIMLIGIGLGTVVYAYVL